MTGDDESCDNSHSLLPAHDSCEVDSLPEDRGKEQGLLPPVQFQFIMIRDVKFHEIFLTEKFVVNFKN